MRLNCHLQRPGQQGILNENFRDKQGQDPLTDTAVHIRLHLETVLRALVKLIKAVNFYPPGHPALRSVLEECFAGFSPLLIQGPLTFSVRKDRFLLGEAPISPENLLLQKLATAFFARRLQQVTVMPDLAPRDLLGLVRCLTLRPPAIQKHGGVQEILFQAQITSVWFNELDLARLQLRKDEIDGQIAALDLPPPDPWDDPPIDEERGGNAAPADPARTLETIFKELQQEKDDQRYRLLVQELIPQIRFNLGDEKRQLIVQALFTLLRDSRDPHLSEARRSHARYAVEELALDEVLDFLLGTLCLPNLEDKYRGATRKILLGFREKAVAPAMELLARESTPQARRYLVEFLAQQDAAAIPLLARYLEDKRWYMVRNAAFTLGEIRDPSSLKDLTPLLDHGELRVRRVAMRAITRIGGQGALQILLGVAQGDDPDLRRLALLSLGALKEPSAIPFLLKTVLRSDPWLKTLGEKRDALKALGEIGSEDALPVLLQVLRRRPFFGRARFDELRTWAAWAIGRIGTAAALESLAGAVNDRCPLVARTAAQACGQKRNEQP
jgi:HEAT repeat protein